MARKDAPYGPLLFINSDPSEGGTVANRRAIYQHVQLKYAKWKRVEQSRTMRESIKTYGRRDSNEPEDSSSQSSQSTSDDSNDGFPIPNPVVRRPPIATKPRPGHNYHGKPLTILRGGNSDPFDVFAVPVGPKINALMEYSRDYYLPGIQRDVNNPGSKVVRPEWAQCVSFLHDQGLAYSHFARIAAVIASDPKQSDVARDFHTQALIFKSKSMALLRKRLEECPEDSTTYNQILLLLNAELYERNFTAATSHAAILVSLLQNGTIKGDLVFLFKVVYNDAQRAAMSLTRPLVDLDHWLPDQMELMSNLMVSRLPLAIRPEAQASELHPSLDSNPPLKRTLAMIKHLCLCLLLVIKDKSMHDNQFIFYGRFHVTVSMGRLVNHYLDAAALLPGDTGPWILEDHSVSGARMSAFISLATLVLLRCLMRIDNVKINGDITLFSANKMLMQRLEKTLTANDRRSVIEVDGKFANARLYALFIGAWIEQAQAAAQRTADGSSPGSSVGSPGLEVNLGWFNRGFVDQARAMKLYQWVDVKKALEGFVYVDVLEPNGAHWFPRIIQTRRGSAS